MNTARSRMLSMISAIALAVSASSGVAAPTVQEAAVSAQSPVPAVETKSVPIEESEASATEFVDMSLAAPNVAAACSPPPQCFRDRDCDRVCGKGNGVCVTVNSCYRACSCAS